jgi:hypothetical protein
MLQILRVNSFLTPSELSVQDYAYVGPKNLFVHLTRINVISLASRILELGTALFKMYTLQFHLVAGVKLPSA